MIVFDADSETEFEAPATWVDVARRLSSLEPAQALWMMRPSELAGARADWTGLTLLISDLNPRPSALSWLSSVFPRRLDIDETSVLILDGPAEVSSLPVEFEVAEGEFIWSRSSLGHV